MTSLKPSNKPKQYTQGWVEFYKLRFKVTPDVLIPRPETELLVNEILKINKFVTDVIKPNSVLDLGTGSGCIAISVAKNLPGTRIIASEISQQALEIAKQNAKFHQVNIEFVLSDLLGNIPQPIGMLVTNLPYIPSGRIKYLDSSVKDFEPLVALDGGEDGFELYRKLFAQISKLELKPKLIIGEIDYTHGELAINEALKYFPDAQVEVKTDLAHKQRILQISLF